MEISRLRIASSPAAQRVAARYVGAIAAGSLLWELFQLPLFTLWQTARVAYLAFAVLHCWAGDLLIASISLIMGVFLAGRAWPQHNYVPVAVIAILIGASYTVFSEWLNVMVRGNWAYAAAMPRLPPLGTGLSPLLQWIVVPLAAFAWARPREAASPRRAP